MKNLELKYSDDSIDKVFFKEELQNFYNELSQDNSVEEVDQNPGPVIQAESPEHYQELIDQREVLEDRLTCLRYQNNAFDTLYPMLEQTERTSKGNLNQMDKGILVDRFIEYENTLISYKRPFISRDDLGNYGNGEKSQRIKDSSYPSVQQGDIPALYSNKGAYQRTRFKDEPLFSSLYEISNEWSKKNIGQFRIGSAVDIFDTSFQQFFKDATLQRMNYFDIYDDGYVKNTPLGNICLFKWNIPVLPTILPPKEESPEPQKTTASPVVQEQPEPTLLQGTDNEIQESENNVVDTIPGGAKNVEYLTMKDGKVTQKTYYRNAYGSFDYENAGGGQTKFSIHYDTSGQETFFINGRESSKDDFYHQINGGSEN